MQRCEVFAKQHLEMIIFFLLQQNLIQIQYSDLDEFVSWNMINCKVKKQFKLKSFHFQKVRSIIQSTSTEKKYIYFTQRSMKNPVFNSLNKFDFYIDIYIFQMKIISN